MGNGPLNIRAHTLLCLQGYRGLGYSPEFIAQMDRISGLLKENPDTPVRIISSADIFCEHCPYNLDGRCTIDDPEDEEVAPDEPDKAVLMDEKVLTRLGIETRDVKPWGKILYIIGRIVDSSVMDEICGDCRWREYGYCEAGLDELHRRVTSGELEWPD